MTCILAEVSNRVAFRLTDQIHEAGLKATIMLNPEIPVETILPYINLLGRAAYHDQRQDTLSNASCLYAWTRPMQLRKMRDEYGYG